MATYEIHARTQTAVPRRAAAGWSSTRAMLVTVLVVSLLTAPVLLYVAAHANLTQWEYEATRLEREKKRQTDRAGRLKLAMEEATAGQRVRAEAERMGLVRYDATQVVALTARVRPAPDVQERSVTSTWSTRVLEVWDRAKAWAGVGEARLDGD